jgi:hypothetical protein
MERRNFLRIMAAASLAPAARSGAAPSPAATAAATVLFDDRAVTLDRIGRDPKQQADALWVRAHDLSRINGFEVKPQGACRADICIPIPKAMLRGDYFYLTAFAKKIGQALVADAGARVWSFGEIPALGGGLASRTAPDVVVSDRAAHPVRLSSFRGKKMLVVTWASW